MPTVEIYINIFRHLTDHRYLAFWALGFLHTTHQTLIIVSPSVVSHLIDLMYQIDISYKYLIGIIGIYKN